MIYSSFTALICTLVYRQHNGNKSKLLVSNHIYISLMLVTHQQRSMCTRINSIISYAQKLFESEKEQTELDLFFFSTGVPLLDPLCYKCM